MQLKNVFKIACVGLSVSYLLIGVLTELFTTLTVATNNYFVKNQDYFREHFVFNFFYYGQLWPR